MQRLATNSGRQAPGRTSESTRPELMVGAGQVQAVQLGEEARDARLVVDQLVHVRERFHRALREGVERPADAPRAVRLTTDVVCDAVEGRIQPLLSSRVTCRRYS
jgi:hypothetical protein